MKYMYIFFFTQVGAQNTFQIQGSGSSKNIVAVSMGPNLKRSESTESIITTAPSELRSVVTSKAINGTLKISTSAPNSPVKTTSVKLQQSSQPPTPSSTPAPSSVQVGSLSASASPTSSSQQGQNVAGFVKPPPKPAEDPDTLKRIQQILDDYNEQIRNSPDLQNRPAPRRRTNGPPTGSTTSPPPPGMITIYNFRVIRSAQTLNFTNPEFQFSQFQFP